MIEEPYMPFYKPYGMSDEEYQYEIYLAEQKQIQYNEMIAAKKEWCLICRTEHIENMHTNKIPEWYAETMFEESIMFVPRLQIEAAYELTILRVNECIKIHYYLDGDGCGIGNSYKFWIQVKDEVIKLKEKYLK